MGSVTDGLMCRPPGLDPCSAIYPVVHTTGSEMPPSGLRCRPLGQRGDTGVARGRD
jgi:hypothetical protein